MLTTGLINPDLIKAIALCGHGDKILISDGNYPLDSKCGNAKKIYLALSRNCPSVTKVLEVLQSVVKFEKAELMSPGDCAQPEIFGEFQKMIPNAKFEMHDRFSFYGACCNPDVKVAILSGESRTFANILLTVGVS